ncbi:YncE family protein [Flavihumibacter petaseus]|uniref:Uncharacterized protein n=1 Tax=Flavihumibacter petaseus NBRC 106054 TaxID=1220578 RepID=A0A0E9N5P3_9BACT|nr:DUF5074 domain-containing protein [Flavihumibacter petaseus]GAO45139.1 hypothetical protein FPE01S_04_03820 [Flavihumibacter petaseus NBRC 106054]
MNRLSWCIGVFAGIAALASCSKDDNPPAPPVPVAAGVYVLSEGVWNQNNTMLTYYDFSTQTAATDYYRTVNNSGLGDTGNDMLIYGSKLYIVMNVSSYIEVADAATATSLKKVEMKDGGTARSPRYAVPYKNKILISCFDGTVAVMDTASLTLEKFIPVGANPEQLLVDGDKLYVANSGSLNFVEPDSTISIIDLTTMTQTKKLVVGTAPAKLAIGKGKLFALCLGIYGTVPIKLVSVDLATQTLSDDLEINAGVVRFFDNKLLLTSGYGGAPKITVLNPDDLTTISDNFITDGTAVTTPYGLSINSEANEVFVTDAKDYTSGGAVFCFDKDGKKKYSFSVSPAISPNTVVPVKKLQ